jgi:hypothetical protein
MKIQRVKIDLTAAEFVNDEVAKATGLTPAQLQTWVNRGLVKPASERNPGTGSRRLYSAYNVLVIALKKHITEFGMPVSTADSFVTALSIWIDAHTIQDIVKQPSASMWFLVSRSEEGSFCISYAADEGAWARGRAENRLFTAINVAPIIRDVLTRLAEIKET